MTDCSNLRNLETQYSDRLNREQSIAHQFYIDEILDVEIECAKNRGFWRNDNASPVDTLVLLVGFSLEPLLLSICYFQPHRILLVVNSSYGEGLSGLIFVNEHVLPFLEQVIERKQLKSKFQLSPEGQVQILREDSPTQVFQFLNEQLREKRNSDLQDVVIDITGGKKSMVSGAFLYAAYTGADIAYIDFDDYDRVKSRPKIGSCHPGLIPNPYHTFALHDWERAKSLYQSFDYKNSALMLDDILAGMEENKAFFTDDQILSVRTLRYIIQNIYDPWSNGDYITAFQEENELHSELMKDSTCYKPLAAVQILGNSNWIDEGEPDEMLKALKELEPRFYSDQNLFSIYVHDEREKVRRLIYDRHDYRSGLLRAIGLHEVLLKARVVKLLNDNLLARIGDDPDTSVDDTEDKIHQRMSGRVFHSMTSNQLEMLLTGKLLIGKAQEGKEPFYFIRTGKEPKWQTKADWVKKFHDLRTLRNKTTHTILPVHQNAAIDSFNILQNNLDDLKKHWVYGFKEEMPIASDMCLSPPDWKELCGWCKVEILPV